MGTIRTKELFSIVKEINNAQSASIEQKNSTKLQRILVKFGILPPVAASLILLTICSQMEKPLMPLLVIALVSLCISYISIIASMMLDMFSNRKTIKQIFKNPLALITLKVENRANTDITIYRKLLQFSLEELRYLQMELSAETNAFTKQTHLISGSIEKIGLIPGILSLVVIWNKLPNQQTGWIVGIALSIPCLQFFSICMLTLLSRFERTIKIIDIAILQKNTQKTVIGK
ncbi:MAG: hypothetical protein ACRCZ4_06355 [Plesiomonas sp.]|uniref:hypothetical protein n=1 Tax=Plesiomonas sp. TaxID=2486279 RepID=UPI003F3C72E0